MGLKLPYYFAIDEDKDFTLTNRLYLDENPLITGEYRQAFRRSNLIFNMGYTKGYKKTSDKKIGGDKSHFFLNLLIILKIEIILFQILQLKLKMSQMISI